MNRTPKYLRPKKQLSCALAFIFLFNTLFPSGFAAAQILFARPGPGVSRLPLDVAAFDAPGFGTVQDAINLASGNVYVSLDSMGRNNLTDANNDDSIGNGGWQLLPRLRLVGYGETFGKDIPLMLPLLSGGAFAPVFVNPTPDTLTLSQGDGSNLLFERVTTLPLASTNDVPSWIERYRADLNGKARVYRLKAENGVQYTQDWIVLLQGSGQGGVAHYYTQGGTRYTFAGDGEYVDYSQDLYQQYRSALAGDPDGLTVSAKTEFSYADTKGHISKVKDEYGRVTSYEWNGDQTLNRIYYLLSTESNNDSFARRATFTYEVVGGQRLVNKVTYKAPDGLGNLVERWIDFDYVSINSQVLLEKIKRQVLGGTSSVDTVYTYDNGRISAVSQKVGTQTSVPQTTYQYTTSTTYSGAKVTVTQTDSASGQSKQSIYEFDTTGSLRLKKVKDQNFDNPTATNGGTKWLEWKYEYYTSGVNQGSTKKVTEPAGKATEYGYDGRGNVTSVKIYSGTTFIREQTYDYDGDNRLKADVLKGQTIDVDGMSRVYGDVKWTHTYTDYSAGGLRVANKVARSLYVNTTYQYKITDTLNTSGLVTESKREGAGQVQTTSFVYHTGSTWQPYKPTKTNSTSDGDISSTRLASVKQYADLAKTVTMSGLSTSEYWYDAFGGVALRKDADSYTRSFDSNKTPQWGDVQTFTSRTGFGEPVWSYVRQGDEASGSWTTLTKGLNLYYPTGELDYGWAGQPENVTDVAYVTSGTGLGRVAWSQNGADTNRNGSVDARRQWSELTYDGFGRVASLLADRSGYSAGYRTSYSYDTLDRVTLETRPDGGTTLSTYDSTLQLYGTGLGGAGWSYASHDALGRLTQAKDMNNVTVTSTFDPYDRPVKVLDDRLGMNTSGSDRASYFVYDSFGNLKKELGPTVRTVTNGGYTDGRRSYAEYDYDVLGRQTKIRQLVNGANTISVADIAMPGGAEVAETETVYDAFDRPVTVYDPLDYQTFLSYDAAGNVYKLEKQVWKTSEPDYATANSSFTSTKMYTAFDAAGRAVKTIDPRGNSFRTTYDLLGNVTAEYQPNQSGTETARFQYAYTPDGLPLSVSEPRLSGTGSTHVVTKYYYYGDSARRYPEFVTTATQDTAASQTSGARTSYKYDWAGRVTDTTLPATSDSVGNTISPVVRQTYDTRGNLLTLTDAEGFKTIYTYDAFNRVLTESKPKRSGSATDDAAFPVSNGLTTTYTYDTAGNLIKEKRNGLYTHYTYNSLGKVIAEGRPKTTDSLDINNAKLTTYRLDGVQTASTTYDYNPNGGGLRGASGSTVANVKALDANLLSVSRGNITGYTLNARGERTNEVSKGLYNGSVGQEYSEQSWYDGLGQRYYRAFNGSPSVYEPITDYFNTSYRSYWKRDQNGNLLTKWDQNLGETAQHNLFTYTYAPTNKETYQTYNVVIKRPPPLGSQSTSPFSNGEGVVYVGAADGNIRTYYNNRDLLSSSTVKDKNVYEFWSVRNESTTTTSYSYFNSGQESSVTVNENGLSRNRSFTYDARGRETIQTDSNGQGVYTFHKGAANYIDAGQPRNESFSNGSYTSIKTSYDADGTVTSKSGTLILSSIVPTVGGLNYLSNVRRDEQQGSGWVSRMETSTSIYDAFGTVSKVTTNGTENTYFYTSSHHLLQSVFSKPSGQTNTQVGNYIYNDNGDVTTEGLGTRPTTYTLDSRGNRISVTNGPYHLHEKRYDADHRPAAFGQKQFVSSATIDRYVFFSYDPFGNQIMAVKANVEEKSGSSSYHVIERDQVTTAAVQGNVQTIRYQDMDYGNRNGYELNKLTDRIKDESFSIADGTVEESWSVLVPFDLVSEPTTALEAPTEAVSDRLGVLPVDVTAPETGLPEVGVGDVAPPIDSSEVAPPAEEGSVATEGEAASFDTNSALPGTSELPGLGDGSQVGAPSGEGEPVAPGEESNGLGLSALPGLPDLSAPGSEQAGQAVSPGGLETPGSALPEALNSTNALEVTAPLGTETSTPPTGDPSEVTPPGTTTSPEVGASPSDGPLDVQLPAELQPPVTPPLGEGVADPIGSVAPPIEWEAKQGVTTFSGTTPVCFYNDVGSRICKRVPDNLNKEQREQLAQTLYVLGEGGDKALGGALDATFDAFLDYLRKNNKDGLDEDELQDLAALGAEGLLSGFMLAIAEAPPRLQQALLIGFTNAVKTEDLDFVVASVESVLGQMWKETYNPIGGIYNAFGLNNYEATSKVCQEIGDYVCSEKHPYADQLKNPNPRAAVYALSTYALFPVAAYLMGFAVEGAAVTGGNFLYKLGISGYVTVDRAVTLQTNTALNSTSNLLMAHIVRRAHYILSNNPDRAVRLLQQANFKMNGQLITRDTVLTPETWGTALEVLTKQLIQTSRVYSGLYSHLSGPGRNIYDFEGNGAFSMIKYDLTTLAGKKEHLGRWYGEIVNYVIYTRPW